MAMEHTCVTHLFCSALTFGRNVVKFQKIIVFQLQSTPSAFSCLFLQELAFDPAQSIMFAESYCSMISGPSPNFGIECSNEFSLRAVAMGAHHLS
jgi:hypothetical protein